MIRNAFHRIDWGLVVGSTFLIGIGLTVLFSINLKDPLLAIDFRPWSQALFAGIGIVVAMIVSRTDYHIWQRFAGWFYVISIALLTTVLFTDPVQGSSRWINLGFFQFQPAEIMKLSLVIMLAHLFSRRSDRIKKPWTFLLSIIYTAIPMVLVLLEPDLGTAAVFGVIWLVMLAMSPINKLYFVATLALAALSIPLVVPFLEPYQQSRITTFFDPSTDTQGAGYNVIQATIALGTGRVFGQGLTAGSQSQLNFLPAQHTDFIFAVVGEKLGFVGTSMVLLALLLVISRGIFIGWRSEDQFGMYLALGIVTIITFHTVINVGMNLQLVPVTGIPLPFLSYGGTHLIITLILVGILHNIYSRRKKLSFDGEF